ncbi:MAG: acyloxyacyl hydrolase [Acidobacteriota bacterium]|nr:acyloxyacyl hydrolase [Acidobacteriota bacterium]
MKVNAVVLLLLLCACALACPSNAGAQSLPSTSLTKGTWDLGLSGTGGTSVSGGVDDVRIFTVGFRVGRILTNEHGSGFVRGNLEWALDVSPVNVYFTEPENVYGASVAPLNLKWNFTSGSRVAPYLQLSEGVLFTNKDLPFPGTSQVNFQSGLGLGFHFFTREKRAWTAEVKYQHISSAGLGDLNPGINTVQFTLGYNWFK